MCFHRAEGADKNGQIISGGALPSWPYPPTLGLFLGLLIFIFFYLKLPGFILITVKFLLVDFGPASHLGRELWLINHLYQNSLCFRGLDEHIFRVFILVSGKTVGQVGGRATCVLQVPSPNSFPSTPIFRAGAVQTTINLPCNLGSTNLVIL